MISALLVVLKNDLAEMQKKQTESKGRECLSYYQYEHIIKRISQIIEDLNGYNTPEEPEVQSFLRGTWKQIKELLKLLSYESYIDDQLEIDEIWNISEALIKRGRFDEEPWKIRAEILTEIYENYFYDRYGCYDPMQDLANAMCTTREENLKRAAIMSQFEGEIGEKAAKLYRELGEKIAQYADKQCVFHLNSNRPIYFDRFLEIVHELGISMKVVDGAAFNETLQQTIKNSGTEYIFEAFQNDMDDQGRLVYDSNIRIVNDFTVWFLQKVGFEWNETDLEYIKGYIDYFRNLGYLNV